MRYRYLHLFLSLMLYVMAMPAVRAQEWRPAWAGVVYNYYTDSKEQPPVPQPKNKLRSLRIVSADKQGTDSIYSFNRIVSYRMWGKEDTERMQELMNRGVNVWMGYYLTHAPNLLQYQMRTGPEGIYYFSGENEFSIHALAQAGHQWDFDTANAIRAEVSRVWYGPVLQSMDSLKTIKLSNGDTLLLSKEHGIVYFPKYGADKTSFILAGVERNGEAEGVKIPFARELYNFNIGDRFQYDKSDPWLDGKPRSYSEQYTIISKRAIGGRYLYHIKGHRLVDGKVVILEKDLSLPGHSSGLYAGESNDDWSDSPEKIYYVSGSRVSTYSRSNFSFYFKPISKNNDTFTAYYDFLIEGEGEFRQTEGLGNVYFLSRSHSTEEYQLTAVKQGSYTFGKFYEWDTAHLYPDTFRQPEPVAYHIMVGPNPAYGHLDIEFSLLKEEADIRVELTSLQGQTVLYASYGHQPPGSTKKRLDLQGIAPGLYLLRFHSSKGIEVHKILVSGG